MKLQELRPMLWTGRLEETIDFYTKKLGFTCAEKSDELRWASLHRDGIEIMLSTPNEHILFEKPFFTGTLYITTDNIEALWDSLKDKLKIVYGIETFEWGMREFAIHDNNGYIIQFGQQVAPESG